MEGTEPSLLRPTTTKPSLAKPKTMEPSLAKPKTMEPSSEATTVSLPEKGSPAPSQDAGSSAEDELVQTTTELSTDSKVTTESEVTTKTTNMHHVNDAKDIGIVTESPSAAEFDTTTVIATSISTSEAIVYYNSDTFRYRQ